MTHDDKCGDAMICSCADAAVEQPHETALQQDGNTFGTAQAPATDGRKTLGGTTGLGDSTNRVIPCSRPHQPRETRGQFRPTSPGPHRPSSCPRPVAHLLGLSSNRSQVQGHLVNALSRHVLCRAATYLEMVPEMVNKNS